MVNKDTKHADTINKLVDRLNDSGLYQCIAKNVDYYNKGNTVDNAGEVDTYGMANIGNKSYMLIFEIKSTDRQKNYNHAVKQLERSYAHYKKFVDQTICFYVSNTKKDDKGLSDLVIKRVRCEK